LPGFGQKKTTKMGLKERRQKLESEQQKLERPDLPKKNGGFALYKWWIHANVLLVLAKKLTIKWDLSDHVGVLTTKNWMIVV